MANTFKNASAQKIGTGYTEVYGAPTSTTTVILAVSLCNRTTGTITISAYMRDGGTDGSSNANHRMLLNDVEIPAGSTLEVLAGQKYILEATDEIFIKSSVANSLDVVMGVMEITS